MKKLFYAFVIAATALLGGCQDVGTVIPLPEGSDNTALPMNYCEVNARINNNYVIFLETQSAGETTRRVAFDITAENATAGVPVGTFSVADGTMKVGNFEKLLTGSYYLRLTEAPVLSLIEEATLTIAQKEDGTFTFEAKISGNYNEMADEGEEDEKFVDVECKYEGVPVVGGMQNGQFTEFESFVCIAEYSLIQDGENLYAQWEFMNLSMNYYYYMATGKFYSNDLATYPIGMVAYTLLTKTDGERGERILPQGTFPVDFYNFGYENTLLGAEAEYIDPTTGEDLYGPAYDGNATIKALGGGQYEISSIAYSKYGAYKTTAQQVLIVDNTQMELEIPNGGIYLDWQENTAGDHYVMTTIDMTNELLLELHFYGNTSGDEGLASGVYKVSNTTNLEGLGSEYAGVVLMGQKGADGYFGSMIYTFDSKIAALIQGGEITVTNNAGVYTVEFAFEDQAGIYYYGGGSSSVNIEYPSQYNLSQATATFLGQGAWYVDLFDMTKVGGQGLVLSSIILSNEENTYADGLPVGEYTFDITGAVGTALAGGYSALLSTDYTSLYALLEEGTISISAEGSTYTIAIDCADESGNKHHGTYVGTVELYDDSEAEASAPKKAQSVTNWSNYNNQKEVALGAHLTKENAVKAHARKAEIK